MKNRRLSYPRSRKAKCIIGASALALSIGTGFCWLNQHNTTQASIADYQSIIQNDAPLCYWAMQETSGTTLADSSGNSCPSFSLTGGATLNQAGPIGKAVSFNGTDGSAQTATAVNLSDTNQLSIEAILTAKTPSGNYGGLLSTVVPMATGGFIFEQSRTPAAWVGYMGPGTQATIARFNDYSTPASSGDIWHHVVMQFDRSQPASSQMSLYIDGQLAPLSADYSTNPTLGNTTGNFVDYALRMAIIQIGDNEYFANMKIQHLALYDNILTQPQVATHFGVYQTNTAPGTVVTHTISASELWDNGYNNTTDIPRQSSMSRFVFDTNADTIQVTGTTTLASGNDYANLGVMVDGGNIQTLQFTTTGQHTYPVHLPGTSGSTRRVEIVSGLNTINNPPLKGTFIDSVSHPASSSFSVITPTTPDNRIVLYGDSISVGADATSAQFQGIIGLLRAQGYSVMSEGWGSRKLGLDTGVPFNQSNADALVNRLASYQPATIWLAMGTNDYGPAGVWNAADFGAAYEKVVNGLIAALPNAHIVCQTPIHRSDNSTNSRGDTLQDYRDAIAKACSGKQQVLVVDGSAFVSPENVFLHPNTIGHAEYAQAIAEILPTLTATASFGERDYYVVGTSDPIRYTVSQDPSRLATIAVDGNTLTPDQYAISAGSTVIELKADYLKTLTVGTHTLTAYFTGNVVVNGAFSILMSVPRTGLATSSPDSPDGVNQTIITSILSTLTISTLAAAALYVQQKSRRPKLK